MTKKHNHLINGKSEMRTDMVRVGISADIRYRPEYKKDATLTIEFNEGIVSLDQI